MDNLRRDINRPRILLADDHCMFTETLRTLLEKSYTVIGVVPDGRALVANAPKLNPDLIVVDVGMPLLNGLDAARRLTALLPKVKIVFLTMQDDPNLAAAALELGRVGFVLKHSAASELLTAIEYVLRGKSYVTPKLRSEDWAMRANRVQQFSKELSPRQRDIVQLFAEGRSPKEICGLLNLTYKTVMFHKYHIMELFHMKSNADLVIFALQHSLIQLKPVHETSVSRDKATSGLADHASAY